jgi:hypothetical protein
LFLVLENIDLFPNPVKIPAISLVAPMGVAENFPSSFHQKSQWPVDLLCAQGPGPGTVHNGFETRSGWRSIAFPERLERLYSFYLKLNMSHPEFVFWNGSCFFFPYPGIILSLGSIKARTTPWGELFIDRSRFGEPKRLRSNKNRLAGRHKSG